ncbi:TetR family transcriptional regulator [Streptomyces glaucus]|uniref:ScbR family autoregulator-binding transcription factor n=1 Tax=Streptomyces glaucus TaxID=284029 RepID=A0ABN3K464_9ACTN
MVRQERAIRTRQALLRVAAETFAREGYACASLPAISDAAGVGRGALHFHSSSKGALAEAVVAEAGARLDLILQRARHGEDRPALRLLAEATHALVEGITADAVVRAGFRLDVDVTRKGGTGLWKRWEAWVRGVLAEAERSGEPPPGLSRSALAAVVVAATAGFETLAARDPK